MINELNTRL